MPELQGKSSSRRPGRPKGSRNKPKAATKTSAKPKPVEIETQATVQDELGLFLDRFNTTFGTDLTKESIENAAASLKTYLNWIHRNYVATDWPLLLHTSTEYAKFRIAEKFGVIDTKEDNPLPGYECVKSRHLELLGA